MTTYKTSKKQFEVFKKEARKWVDAFSLNNWELVYKHETVKDCVAGMGHNNTGRQATLFLSKDWVSEIPNGYEVRKSAFHEVIELLLAPLRDLATSRYITEDQVESEIHNIIHSIERVVFDKRR